MRIAAFFQSCAVAVTIACSAAEDAPSMPSGATAPSTSEPDAASAEPASCDDIPITAANPVFPCDVEAVITAKCLRCHLPRGVECPGSCIQAPFSLATWTDLHTVRGGGSKIWQLAESAIETGFMPLRAVPLTPPVENLTDEEKQILLDWFAGCALPEDGVVCN